MVFSVGGYFLNQQANKRAERKQEAQEKRAREERQEQREKEDLKYYLNRMSELVTDKELNKTSAEIIVEIGTLQIARILTANILRELSNERRNQVMFFLNTLYLTKNYANKSRFSILEGIQLNKI